MPPRRNTQAEVDAEAREANPTQQLVDILLRALQGRQMNPPPVETNTPKTITFKDFKTAGPPEFSGIDEPIKAQTWITEIEKVFYITKVREEDKTDFATFCLRDEANHWWEAHKTRVEDRIISWDRFKEIFFETYFPCSIQNRMEVQFLELNKVN